MNRVFETTLTACAVLATACASVTSGQRAETLGKGGKSVALETSYRATIERDTVLAFPLLGVTARYGVTDRIDAGVRLGSAGLGIQGKFRLRDSERSVLSLAPTIDWVHAYDDGVGFDAVETALPLLAGFRIRPDLQLIASARAHSSLLESDFGRPTSLHTLGVGAAVGVAVQTQLGWVLPEFGVLWPFLVTGHPPDEMGGTTTAVDRVIAQLSLSFLLENP